MWKFDPTYSAELPHFAQIIENHDNRSKLGAMNSNITRAPLRNDYPDAVRHWSDHEHV
jgi:hypothetical protein